MCGSEKGKVKEVSECECERERERESVCVCVSLEGIRGEREREREREVWRSDGCARGCIAVDWEWNAWEREDDSSGVNVV